MARAYGSSAHLLMKRETVYGQAATGNYLRMPFNRCNLGSEQGLIDDPVLGQLQDLAQAGQPQRLCLGRPLLPSTRQAPPRAAVARDALAQVSFRRSEQPSLKVRRVVRTWGATGCDE